MRKSVKSVSYTLLTDKGKKKKPKNPKTPKSSAVQRQSEEVRSVLWVVSWDGCKALHVAWSAGAGERKLGVGWNICQPPKARVELFLITWAKTFPNKLDPALDASLQNTNVDFSYPHYMPKSPHDHMKTSHFSTSEGWRCRWCVFCNVVTGKQHEFQWIWPNGWNLPPV